MFMRSRQKLGGQWGKIFGQVISDFEMIFATYFVIFVSSILPALGKWSHVSILLTDGDIVRCGIRQARLRYRLELDLNALETPPRPWHRLKNSPTQQITGDKRKSEAETA